MREILAKAVQAAGETGSFHAMNRCEKAKNVCAFGLGRYFAEAFDAWEFRKNLGVNLVCDNDPAKWGGMFKGLPCVSPAELARLDGLIVIPMIGDGDPVFRQMAGLGIPCLDSSTYLLDFMANVPRSVEWFRGNRIMDTYDLLCDDESRRVYASVMCNRLLGPRYSYRDLFRDTEYFTPDVVTLRDDEVFVDCGAYTGDSILQFVAALGGRGFKAIHAFEASAANFAELEKVAARIRENENSGKIACYQMAVFDQAGELSLGREEHGAAMSYSVRKNGAMFATERVPAVRIDDIARDATFIKMDIEGAELNALRGAEQTIKANAPKLAICLYHRLPDFWEIPMYLRDIVPDYRFYVRHHGITAGWTILYACE